MGHVLALLLARPLLRVGLVVQPPADPESGTGHSDIRAYALNQRSRSLLEGLRCWPQVPSVTAVLDMHVREAGAAGVHFSARTQQVPALAWIVDVPALEAQLAAAVRFQPHIEVLEAPVDARLTVVCEGRDSLSGLQFGAELDKTPYAQWAIAARVRCELPHNQAARQWFRPQDIVGFLPLDGEQGNSMAVVWSVEESRRTALMEASDTEFAAQLQEASQNCFGQLETAGPRAAWPLQLARAQRWSGMTAGRSWVLAGDAAHSVHPLAGQGLNLGLADAQELAQQLHARDHWRAVDDVRSLRRYERARKAEVVVMGMVTDGLQQLFAREGDRWSSLRGWGMRGFERSGPLKQWVVRQAMGGVQGGRGLGVGGNSTGKTA